MYYSFGRFIRHSILLTVFVFTSLVTAPVANGTSGLQATADFCPGTPQTRLSQGQFGVVASSPQGQPLTPDRVHNSPSTQSSVLFTISDGTPFQVIGGPVCADGFQWWKVHTGVGDGWLVEGNATRYFIDPVPSSGTPPGPLTFNCAGALSTRLAVGARGVVLIVGDSSAVKVRVNAGTAAKQTSTLPSGRQFSVIDGPLCVDSMVWWKVQTSLVSGWIAEGSATDYFIAPIGVPIPTLVPTSTTIPTNTSTLTFTPLPTNTPAPTDTPTPTFTLSPNQVPSSTIVPTDTPTLTFTLSPSLTPSSTSLGPISPTPTLALTILAYSIPTATLTPTWSGPTVLQNEGLMAFSGPGGSYVLNPVDGTTTPVTDWRYGSIPAWSPDGKSLYYGNRLGTILVICNQVLSPHVISPDCISLDIPQTAGTIDRITVAPDSSQLVFSVVFVNSARFQKGSLYIVNRDGTNLRQLTDGSADDVNPTFFPDGKYILFQRDTTLYQMDLITQKLTQISAGFSNITSYALSPDTTKLAVTSLPTGAVYVVDRKTGQVTQLTRTSKDPRQSGLKDCSQNIDWKPSWTHDGAYITFLNYLVCSQKSKFTLYMVSSSGGNIQPLNISNQTFGSAWQPVPDTSVLSATAPTRVVGTEASTAESTQVPSSAATPSATTIPSPMHALPKPTPTLINGLAVPVQVSPVNGAVFSNYPRTTTLTWKAVAGASSYNVQWIYCWTKSEVNQCSAPIDAHVTSTSYTFGFVGEEPGQWRVQAVTGQGQAGGWSAWWTFSYTV